MINFEKLAGEIKAEKEKRNSYQDEYQFTSIKNDYKGFKFLATGGKTSAKLKILFNRKDGRLDRELIRHRFTYRVIKENQWRVTPPCLKQFGMECPICQTTKTIKDIKGDVVTPDVLAYSRRYIAFAYVESIENPMKPFNGEPVKPGDIVLFMYPMSIHDKINEILMSCKNNQDADRLFDSNTSATFVYKVNEGKTGTDMYSFSVDPFSLQTPTAIYTGPDADAQFNALMEGLPALSEMVYPAQGAEDIIKLNSEVADELSKKYLSNNTPEATTANLIEDEVKKQEILQQAQQTQQLNHVIQPVQPNVPPVIPNIPLGDVNQQAAAQAVQTTTTTIIPPVQPSIQATIQNIPNPVAQTTESSKPECFGNFNEIDAKCLICPNSVECQTSK